MDELSSPKSESTTTATTPNVTFGPEFSMPDLENIIWWGKLLLGIGAAIIIICLLKYAMKCCLKWRRARAAAGGRDQHQGLAEALELDDV